MAVKRGRSDDTVDKERVVNKLLGRGATITVEIRGTDEKDRLRLTDFIDQLNALENALRQTERLIYGESGRVYYRITQLRQESPAVITIEAVPLKRAPDPTPIISRFFSYVEQLHEGTTVPAEMDLTALESFRNLAPTKKRHVSEFVVRNGKHQQRLNPTFRQRVDRVIGPDELTDGSVVGALEMINLHNVQRFAIFQTIRNRKVTCSFQPEIKPTIIAALEKYVRVTGTLHYKKWDQHPHEVDVKTLEVFPDERELPTLLDLAGINPNIVGDQEPEEFLAEARRNAER